MPIERRLIELIFRDGSRQPGLEPLCRRDLEHFQLPHQSLICIFDDEERSEFTGSFGEGFCGFFAAIRKFGLRGIRWPQEVLNHVWKSDGLGSDWDCDVVIYLRHQTCESPIGTVITFAHELQHFMQYGFSYKAWRAERLVTEVYTGGALAPWCFPTENETQLVSRRVAERVLGVGVVAGYAKKHIQEENSPEKWRFFLGLDPEESFDLLERTRPWVSEYREALKERFPASSREEPDFAKDNWWE